MLAIVQEAGWVSGPVSVGTEDFVPPGFVTRAVWSKVNHCLGGNYMGKLQRKTAKASTSYGEQARP